jgi:hypothetical protein
MAFAIDRTRSIKVQQLISARSASQFGAMRAMRLPQLPPPETRNPAFPWLTISTFAPFIYMRADFPKFNRYHSDPIEAACQREEYDRYLADLFQPLSVEFRNHEVPFLIEGFLPQGYLAILAGGPKSGKTCIATAMALAVATGTPFAGMPTRQGAVLWMCMEENQVERRQVIDASPLADAATPLYTTYEYLPIDQDDCLEMLGEWVHRTGAKLVVVDPLHGATSGRSLNDGWSARKTLQKFKRFCANYNVTGLVLHHAKDVSGHAPRVAENDQVAATASMNIVLKYRGAQGARKGMEPYRLINLFCTGRGSFANRNLPLISRGLVDYQVLEEALNKPNRILTAVLDDEQRLVEFLGKGPKTVHQMRVRLQWTEEMLRNSITRLRRRGLVRLVKSDKLPRRYCLA